MVVAALVAVSGDPVLPAVAVGVDAEVPELFVASLASFGPVDVFDPPDILDPLVASVPLPSVESATID